MDLKTVLLTLYENEINCGMASFWDGGWTVWIGDDLNGRRVEENFLAEDFDQISPWLHAEAQRLYPAAQVLAA